MKVKYPTRQHIDAPQSFNISLNVLNIDMNTGLCKYKIWLQKNFAMIIWVINASYCRKYFSNITAVIGGGNWSTRRKQQHITRNI